MSRVVCSQCGAPLLDDSKFCSHCGAKVDDDIFRAEITINDTAKVKEVELQERKFDAKGKLIQRMESLGETYKNVSKTAVNNYKERAEARKGVLEEKARKAEAKAAEKKAKAEAKLAEAKIRDARMSKFLFILAGICIVVSIVLYLVVGIR